MSPIKYFEKENAMELPEDMDIPLSRKDISNISNVAWLLRNLGIRNQGHPEFEEVIKFLITLMRKRTR